MFDLTIQTLGGPVKVKAQRVGEHLAIHRAPAIFGSTFWDLSHIHSGRKLGRFVSRRDARAFAEASEGAFAQLSTQAPDFHAEDRALFLNLLKRHGGTTIQPMRRSRC